MTRKNTNQRKKGMFIVEIFFYTLLWIAYVILFAILESLKSIYEFIRWLIRSIREDIKIEKEIRKNPSGGML